MTGIKTNKDLLEVNDGCHTFLQYCCQFNLDNIVEELLKLGANPNMTHVALKDTPIMISARKGNVKILSKLLDHNADQLDFSAVNGETALHCVVEGVQSIAQADHADYLECMNLLLTKVAKVITNYNTGHPNYNTVINSPVA